MNGISINGPKIYFTIPIFGGIQVTQTLVTSFVVTLILCVSGVLLGRGLKKRPGKRQVLTEKAVTVITDMVKEAMGAHNAHWAPLIATIFLSSLLGTFLGMTGVLKSSTADISTTMTWALMVSAICWYQAIKNNGFLSWLKGFTEPIAIMTPMNIVSEIAQPVSLAFRHFGNIAGGGVITTLLYAALSAASVGILKLIGSSSVAIIAALLVAGVLLVLLSRPKNGGKRKLLPWLVGLACIALGSLGAINWLWDLTGRAWPKVSTGIYAVIFAACLIVLIFALVQVIRNKTAARKLLGWILLAVSALVLILVSDGPLGVPVLTLGLPAVLSLYFDVFSGVIQAFVFSLLTMIYISGNCPPPAEAAKPEK